MAVGSSTAHPLDRVTPVSKRTVESVFEALKERGNARNRILYAEDTSFPGVVWKDPEQYFSMQTEVVFAFAAMYLLIEQCRDRQPFAQMALDAFLRTLNGLPALHSSKSE